MHIARHPLAALCVLGAFSLVVACSGAADEARPEEGVLEDQPDASTGQAPSQGEAGSEPGAEADAGDEAAAPAKKALAEDCGGDEECESGVCFVGGKSSYCTLPCTAENAEDVCVAPFDGRCNKQGRCRRPD